MLCYNIYKVGGFMKEQELEKIREEYKKSTKSKERLLELKAKINMLEQNSNVEMYLQFAEIYSRVIKKNPQKSLELKEKMSMLEQNSNVVKYLQFVEIYNRFIKKNQKSLCIRSNEDLLIDVIVNNPITKTNNIYVDMGIFSLENGKLCRKYRNIELLSNQQDYEVMVMKDEIKLFENENIIINLPLKKRDDKNYLKIKEQFYIDSINEGQENAIKKILSMND